MTREYCPQSDLPVETCAHCQGVRPEPRAPVVTAFRARYAGACGRQCDGIEEGDLITNGEGGYVHVGECP